MIFWRAEPIATPGASQDFQHRRGRQPLASHQGAQFYPREARDPPERRVLEAPQPYDSNDMVSGFDLEFCGDRLICGRFVYREHFGGRAAAEGYEGFNRLVDVGLDRIRRALKDDPRAEPASALDQLVRFQLGQGPSCCDPGNAGDGAQLHFCRQERPRAALSRKDLIAQAQENLVVQGDAAPRARGRRRNPKIAFSQFVKVCHQRRRAS